MNPGGYDHANIYPIKYQEDFHGVGQSHDTFKLQTVVIVDCNLKLPTDKQQISDLDGTSRKNWRDHGNQVITGCSTLWIQRGDESGDIQHTGAPYDRLQYNNTAKDHSGGGKDKRYMHYDPMSVIVNRSKNGGAFGDEHMTAVSEVTDDVTDEGAPSFEYLASHYGTIYVYKRYRNNHLNEERAAQMRMGMIA